MSLHNAIRSLLVSDSEMASLVADRVRPFEAGQNETRPFIVLDIETTPRQTYDGSPRSSKSIADVGLYADDFPTVAQMIQAAQRILHGFSGIQSGERISYLSADSESGTKTTTLTGNSNPVFVNVITYNCTHRPAGG